ncbi:TPA: hypothetical protein I8273_004832 [Aeromonas hydrophila]|nr:hypothetical protein [Aeromonas hydrophila]
MDPVRGARRASVSGGPRATAELDVQGGHRRRQYLLRGLGPPPRSMSKTDSTDELMIQNTTPGLRASDRFDVQSGHRRGRIMLLVKTPG